MTSSGSCVGACSEHPVEPSSATGSSPGAGAGGGLGADVSDGDALQMGGCQSGGQGTTWPMLLGLFVVLGLSRRTRMTVQG